MEDAPKILNHILHVQGKNIGSSFETAKVFSKEVFEHCLKNSCSKILIEYGRDTDTILTDTELFKLGEYNAHIMPSIIRLAVLSEEKHFEKLKLWEDVCTQRGANVKIFSDYESAIEWLKQV